MRILEEFYSLVVEASDSNIMGARSDFHTGKFVKFDLFDIRHAP
jgi:hypothetical protein